MSSIVRIAGVCALASFATLAAAAPQPLLPITSNDAAARGVVRMLDSYADANRPIQALVEPMRRLSEFALTSLASSTTAQALLTARGGVTVPCPFGGTINAKLSRNDGHVLKIYWRDCVRLEGQSQPSYTGHSDLTLPSDTLTPTGLEKMRFGSAAEPFIETGRFPAQTETDPTVVNTTSWDVQLVGTLPMTRFLNSPFGIFVGDFEYRLNASYEQTSRYTYANPDAAPFQQTNYVSAIDFRASGSTYHTDENRVLHEVINVQRGSFAMASESTYQPLQTVQAYELIKLDVNQVLDARNGISMLTADGKIDYEWPPYLNATCGNGVYSFNTLIPIRQYDVFHVDGRDQGKVRINQTAVATFAQGNGPAPPDWYTPIPNERPTTVSVKMGSAGTFTHTSYFPTSTLPEFMQCPGPN
ncbi:MAG TPA: hypothetical protein VGO61_00700 [Steroidobacteraceae bacterium]|jgi:hypothetical protein|nr:hypothetical protein [Steroidobacteraceae bacterium]